MCEDFKNLVTWAHSHSTICAHVPSPAEGYRLDEVNTFVLPFNCSAGHAYNWPVASLSGRVVEAKKVLSWTKKRKRGPLEAEEEKTELTEGAADLAAREEAPAELDDSQSSLFTNVSGEQDYGREQRDVPTPELPKVKTQKKKQRKKKRPSSSSTGMPREPALTSNASGTESGDFLNLPQILRLAETALQQIEHFAEDFAANVSAANVSALDDSSMHLEDLDSNADCASEDELMNQSQSGRGDSASTTPSRVQRGSQSEGHPSPVAGPSTSTSTSTASSSTKGKKTGAASSMYLSK